MTSEKSSPVYKAILRSVLKAEIQLLLNRLSENGEESLLLTATATDLQNASPIYSKLGGGFFEKEAVSLQEIGKKFQTYCQEHPVAESHGIRDSNPSKKRKLSSSEDVDYNEISQDNNDVQEVIVYVTEAAAESKTEQKRQATSSGGHIVAGMSDLPVYSEAFSEHITQVPASTMNAATSASQELADPTSQVTTEVVILSQHNDDQSKMLWMDYMPAKPSETSAVGNTIGQETTAHENVIPADQQQDLATSGPQHSTQIGAGNTIVLTQSVDEDNTKVPEGDDLQDPEAEKVQDIIQIAVSDFMGGDSGRILLRNQATNKFISIPKSSSGTVSSPQRQRVLQGQAVKLAKQNNPSVVKKSPATSYSGYLSRMSSGKSIMIRAGEDAFEEIQTLRVPDTYEESSDIKTEGAASPDERSRSLLEWKNLETDSPRSGAEEIEEETKMVVTDSGETVHILKNPTEEELEKSDIPFEEMFDLLGKSARCLVCGKIMLKRNRRYHWRFHTGTKPYTCEYCEKKFYHPSNLKTHLFIHLARNR